MKINPNIFGAYDVRGVYPEEINEETVYEIGRAYVKFLKARKIVVGRDCRLSSPSLFKALTKGIRDQGANVIDVGIVSTPMLYFSVIHLKADGGIEITASHNSGEYNGLKMVREAAKPLSGDSGLKEIEEMALQGSGKAKIRGRLNKKNIENSYLKNIWQQIDPKKIRKFKVVIDAGNGMGSLIVSELFKKLKAKVYPLYFDLDGSFPNHLPNPLLSKNLVEIKKEIKKRKADLGIAFDGDADRVVFIDEKGKEVPGDLITALLASCFSQSKILYDIRSSRIVKEEIEKNGNIAVPSRIGHSFIKETMRKEKIAFAGELSGHYYFQDNGYIESPLTVVFMMLSMLADKTLSQAIKPLRKYHSSGELNFIVKNKKQILKKIAGKHKKKGKISWIDGLTVEFPDHWFNLRASNTENLLRLNLEADSKKLKEEKVKEISSYINA